MSWVKICDICKHEKDFDPLTDECPHEDKLEECIKKQLNVLLKENRLGASRVVEAPEKPRRRNKRPAPMPEPKPYYTHGDKYPDSVRICFEDGHTEIYDRRISQPSPVGYVNNPRRGKA